MWLEWGSSNTFERTKIVIFISHSQCVLYGMSNRNNTTRKTFASLTVSRLNCLNTIYVCISHICKNDRTTDRRVKVFRKGIDGEKDNRNTRSLSLKSVYVDKTEQSFYTDDDSEVSVLVRHFPNIFLIGRVYYLWYIKVP